MKRPIGFFNCTRIRCRIGTQARWGVNLPAVYTSIFLIDWAPMLEAESALRRLCMLSLLRDIHRGVFFQKARQNHATTTETRRQKEMAKNSKDADRPARA